MKLFLLIIGLPVLFFSLVGCGYFGSVYREFAVDDGSGALIDIKQRAIITSKQEKNGSGGTAKQTIVCAEPSPDALSVYAAEIATEGSVPEYVKDCSIFCKHSRKTQHCWVKNSEHSAFARFTLQAM